MTRQRTSAFYYFLLLAVVLIWGLDPIVYTYFYNSFSAGMLSTVSCAAALVFFIILFNKRLLEINRKCLKIAIPISLIKAAANIFQRIGLQYTTPAAYSFLEHLSCLFVPVAMVLLTRKSPRPLVWISASISLVGCVILVGFDGLSAFGVGEALCALSGVVAGLGTAMTSLYTKRIDIVIFMTVFMLVYFASSLGTTLVLGLVPFGGVIIEPIVFDADAVTLIAAMLYGILSVGLCWLMQTAAIININPTSATVISRLSAVVTGVASVLIGFDRLTPSLVLSGSVLALASVVAGIAESRERRLLLRSL